MDNFLEHCKIIKCAAGAAAGTSTVDGDAVDLSGFEGVVFMASIAVANAGNYLKAQEGDTNSPSADIEGSKVVTASNDDVAILQVHKPLKRYIRANIVRGASSASGDLFAILYKGSKMPLSSDVANAVISKSIVSPVAGTP